MVYNFRGNEQYLKSRFGKIGRFSCILGFFPIFMIFSRQNGGRGLSNWPEKLHISDTRGRFSIFIHMQIDSINFIQIN